MLGAVTLVVGAIIAAISNFDEVPDTALGMLGLTLAALGVQGIFSSFFLSILGERARDSAPPRRLTDATRTYAAAR